MYFCPLHREWFEDFNNDNVNYVYNLRAIEENQTIIDKWNTVSAPPAPELKSIADSFNLFTKLYFYILIIQLLKLLCRRI